MPQSEEPEQRSASSARGKSAANPRRTPSSGRASSAPPSLVQLAQQAAQQLSEMTGRTPDTIASMERTDDGWLVRVEVVELERIPASTSVLASYEVQLDTGGEMRSYRRTHRYYRNQAGEA